MILLLSECHSWLLQDELKIYLTFYLSFYAVWGKTLRHQPIFFNILNKSHNWTFLLHEFLSLSSSLHECLFLAFTLAWFFFCFFPLPPTITFLMVRPLRMWERKLFSNTLQLELWHARHKNWYQMHAQAIGWRHLMQDKYTLLRKMNNKQV